MSDEADRILNAIEFHANQIDVLIDEARKNKVYLNYDETRCLSRKLEDLGDRLSDYDTAWE